MSLISALLASCSLHYRPRYTTGHSINIGALGLIIILTSASMAYQGWENRQRVEGKRDQRLQEEPQEELGYRHPGFRYTL